MNKLRNQRDKGIKLPIRHKITIYVAVLICITIGINTYTTVRTETKILTNKIIYDNKRLVRNVGFRIKKALLVSNWAAVEELLTEPTMTEYGEMIYIKIVKPDGKVCMANESSFVGETVAPSLLLEQESVITKHFFPQQKLYGMLVVQPTTIDNEKWHIIAGFPSIQIKTTIRYLIFQNLLSGSFVMLLGTVVSFFLAKTICDPILNLTKAAKVIANGDLTHRVTTTTKDEVGELAVTFNDMAGKLEKSRVNLEENLNELNTEKKLLSVTLDGMSEGLIALDTDKRIVLFNKVAENLTGWKFRDVKGKPVDRVFQIVNERADEPTESTIDKALQSGKTESGTQYDVLISKNDDKHPIFVCTSPIDKSENAIIRAIIVFRDVSHERELNRMKSDFTSSVSHELRTPLTSIKAYTETILRDPNMPEDIQRQFLGIIEEESNRLATLIEDLLEVSRINSGTVKIKYEIIDLLAVTKRVLVALEPLAQKKNIQLKANIANKLPELQADEGKIESVITNLVNNAIKFTPEKGQVSINIKEKNEQIVMSVSDTGMGIPKEALPKIFERFYRVNRPGKQIQGTGLGLSIVKKIILMHNGRIDVESEEGQGTTFTIFLPLKAEEWDGIERRKTKDRRETSEPLTENLESAADVAVKEDCSIDSAS